MLHVYELPGNVHNLGFNQIVNNNMCSMTKHCLRATIENNMFQLNNYSYTSRPGKCNFEIPYLFYPKLLTSCMVTIEIYKVFNLGEKETIMTDKNG